MQRKDNKGSPVTLSWTEGQERAREALERWRAAPSPACLLHGPPGVGKTALCARLTAEAGERAGGCVAVVHVGRASRFASEQEILASLLAQLGEDALCPPRDVVKLRSDLRNRLANGQDEDEPEMLLVLDGLDECVDWPCDARISTLRELGERVRCLVSITGGEDEAHAFRGRLGWAEGEVHLIEVAPPSRAEAEARGIPSWVAAGGDDGPGAEAVAVEGALCLVEVRRHGSAHLALGGAPVSSMLAFTEPSWVEAISAEALACALTDLRRLRDRIGEEVERCGALPPTLAAALVRCAAAQGAAATLGDAEPWASSDADLEAPQLEANAARAFALIALAREVSPPARAGVLERAFGITEGTGARWSSPAALIAVAEAAEGERRIRIARAALEAARRAEGEDALRGIVAAAGLLPEEDAQEIAAEAIERAGGAPAALVPGPGGSQGSAVALERASRSSPAPQRIRLLARLLAALPAEARARAVQEIERLWEPWCLESKEEAEAVAPYLSERLLERALEEVPVWPVHALAARLASLGREAEAHALVLRWAGSSAAYRADALLRLGETLAPERRPVDEVRALFEELAPEERCRLIKEHPAVSAAILGVEAVLRAVEDYVDPSGSYLRIVALARLATALPEPMREEAARRALLAFEAGGADTDALGELCGAAPWMSAAEAARLVSASLFDASGAPSLAGVFQGWASVAQLAGVIRRAGGEEAVLAAAEEVTLAGRWLHSEA